MFLLTIYKEQPPPSLVLKWNYIGSVLWILHHEIVEQIHVGQMLNCVQLCTALACLVGNGLLDVFWVLTVGVVASCTGCSWSI